MFDVAMSLGIFCSNGEKWGEYFMVTSVIIISILSDILENTMTTHKVMDPKRDSIPNLDSTG